MTIFSVIFSPCELPSLWPRPRSQFGRHCYQCWCYFVSASADCHNSDVAHLLALFFWPFWSYFILYLFGASFAILCCDISALASPATKSVLFICKICKFTTSTTRFSPHFSPLPPSPPCHRSQRVKGEETSCVLVFYAQHCILMGHNKIECVLVSICVCVCVFFAGRVCVGV